jgi:hypothetical protein
VNDFPADLPEAGEIVDDWGGIVKVVRSRGLCNQYDMEEAARDVGKNEQEGLNEDFGKNSWEKSALAQQVGCNRATSRGIGEGGWGDRDLG